MRRMCARNMPCGGNFWRRRASGKEYFLRGMGIGMGMGMGLGLD